MKNVHIPNITRISFASKSKFKICLLKGGMSKDASLSKSVDLSQTRVSASLDLSQTRVSIKQTLENLPSQGVINVYGKHGIGKSTYFSKINHVSFDHDILKSKERTCDFLDMMRFSKMPLVLDDYELVENLPGIKEIKSIKTPFYIISCEKISGLDSITEYYEFPGVSFEEFAKSHSITESHAKELLKKTNGNMTSVGIDLSNFKSERDIFMDSKNYVKNLIHSSSVTEFIDKPLSEHGNVLGIVHENYPDFSNDFEKITQSLSDADLIDMKIYSEVSWDLMNYFNVSACLVPSLYLSKGSDTRVWDKSTDLDKSIDFDLRPGSIWTKTSNMLMKRNRLKKLRFTDREEICVWVAKANAGEELDFDSYDLDSINQLSFTKIKPKLLTILKKKCRSKS